MTIDYGFNIYDFVIWNDEVFFCGSNASGEGIIGHFDINDFFFGTHGYYIESNILLTAQSHVSILQKIVAYNDVNGTLHVVAYGETTTGQYCLASYTYTSSTGWQFEIGSIPTNSPETITEIVTTDAHVVTSGFYYGNTENPNLSIRVFNRDNIFSDPYNIHDYTNILFDLTNQISFCLDKTSMVKVSCDAVTISSFWKYHQDTSTITPIIAQKPRGTYIGQYDISIPKQIMNHHSSILIPHNYYNGGWEIYGFSKYNTISKTYNLLLRYETDLKSPLQIVVFEISDNVVQGVFPFTIATSDTYRFSSIDGNALFNTYLLSGYPNSNPSQLTYNMGVQGGNHCLTVSEKQPEPVIMGTKSEDCPMIVTPVAPATFDLYISVPKEKTIIIDCIK